MALRMQLHDDLTQPGAYCFAQDKPKNGDDAPVFIDRYPGVVLADREHNMADDSDWYAIVWNPVAEKPIYVTYATTRGGGTERNRCDVDAPQAVQDAYENWCLRRRADEIRRQRADDMRTAERAGITFEQYTRLMDAYGRDDRFNSCLQLLITRKGQRFRSAFRKSLAEQVFQWLEDTASRYSTPLTPKQLACILPNRQMRLRYG